MSDHVTSLRWLGNQLDADAADKGIGQGSEGARICWSAVSEIESLRQQLADSQKQVTLLRSYLEAIVDPIKYMRAKLEDGQRINGQMAIQLSESHYYLKDLAKEALDATELK